MDSRLREDWGGSHVKVTARKRSQMIGQFRTVIGHFGVQKKRATYREASSLYCRTCSIDNIALRKMRNKNIAIDNRCFPRQGVPVRHIQRHRLDNSTVHAQSLATEHSTSIGCVYSGARSDFDESISCGMNTSDPSLSPTCSRTQNPLALHICTRLDPPPASRSCIRPGQSQFPYPYLPLW
jgi:hypothetical protein